MLKKRESTLTKELKVSAPPLEIHEDDVPVVPVPQMISEDHGHVPQLEFTTT